MRADARYSPILLRNSSEKPSRRSFGLALGALVAAPTLWAQGGAAVYPDRPLRVIVPQPPGGGFDFVSRVLAERLARGLGQNVVVENRPGSGTLVGTDLAAKAPADGYTLLTGSVSNIALNMGLYRNLPYDSLRDFEVLGLAVAYSYTLMARKDLGLTSLRELVAAAKAQGGKFTYASAGNGSGQHVIAAALWHLAGVQLTHVPYRGAQAAYQDLLGGRVDLFFDLSSTARTQVEACVSAARWLSSSVCAACQCRVCWSRVSLACLNACSAASAACRRCCCSASCWPMASARCCRMSGCCQASGSSPSAWACQLACAWVSASWVCACSSVSCW